MLIDSLYDSLRSLRRAPSQGFALLTVGTPASTIDPARALRTS